MPQSHRILDKNCPGGYVRFCSKRSDTDGTVSRNSVVRRRNILETLNSDGYVEVEKLAGGLGVSTMTIRRDLTDLETGGYLVRTHGGAVKSAAIDAMFTFDSRINRNRVHKEAICLAAAAFVEPGDTIFIDCGTTLYRLARYIRDIRNVRIVTNSLPLLTEIAGNSSVRITLTGGDLVRERKALYGRIAESMIASVHADKAFIGADGVCVERGLTSYDEKEAGISRGMAESADSVFLLCDSSKLGHSSFYRFGPVTSVDTLVTDGDASGEIISRIRDRDIEVMTAKSADLSYTSALK